MIKTHIFLVLSNFCVKLHGLNHYFIERLNYAATVNCLRTNGFPRAIRNLLISRQTKNNLSNNQPRTRFFDENDTRPKIWDRIPFLGKQGETLVKKYLKKIQRCLTVLG